MDDPDEPTPTDPRFDAERAPERAREQAFEQALRAPGSAAELAEEERYIAMFRAHLGSGDTDDRPDTGDDPDGSPDTVAPVVALPRRAASRLAAGTSLAAVLALTTGGVAAAYTAHLPAPIQRVAHHVLPGAPAPIEDRHTAAPHHAPSPSPSATPTPTPSVTPSTPPSSPSTTSTTGTATAPPRSGPTGSPSPSTHPGGRHRTHPGSPGRSASPSASPTSPSVSPSPSQTPTAPPPPAPVGSVDIAAATHVVTVGDSLTFSGTVTGTDGSAEDGRAVRLLRRTPGGGRWQVVGTGTTGESGQVSVVAPAAATTATYRLRSRHVHSDAWRVAMRPQVTATPTTSAGSTTGTKHRPAPYVATVSVSAEGGQPGDTVRLVVRRGHRPVVLQTRTLDADGGVTFTTHPRRRHVHYVVLLESTPEHTADKAKVDVERPS